MNFGKKLGNQSRNIPTNKYRLQFLQQAKNYTGQLCKGLKVPTDFTAKLQNTDFQLSIRIKDFQYQIVYRTGFSTDVMIGKNNGFSFTAHKYITYANASFRINRL